MICVHSGKFSVENARTISGKKYKLINLPFYLIHKLNISGYSVQRNPEHTVQRNPGYSVQFF